MIRFSWLQSRLQTLTVAGIVGAVAIMAAVTGVELSHLYDTQVLHCRTGCDFALGDFLHHDNFVQHAFDILALVTPALLGIFWGAPLFARELETGTYRLAWTQSVTRRRWLSTKLAIGAATTVAVAAAVTLTITWWSRSLDLVGSNQFDLFDRRDIAPIGYALFAFAVGAFLGVVIRRVVPAMAATLGVFVLARVAMATWIRPHLLPPLRKTVSILNTAGFGFVSNNGGPVTLVAKGSPGPNAWTQSTEILTSSGHQASNAQLVAFVRQRCPGIANPPPVAPGINHPVKGGAPDAAQFEACRAQAARTFHLLVSYQPAGRYWTFQWMETGIFVALALLAAAGCYWWITRRAT